MMQMNAEYILVVAALFFLTIIAVKKKDAASCDSLISLDVSFLLKAWCCILIILHHYALRDSSFALGVPFARIGGFFSLVCFLMLSSYGIAKVEQKKHSNFVSFAKKRFLKLLIPLWITTLISVAVYALVGADNVSVEDVLNARGNKYFVLIGQGRFSLTDFLKILFCVDLIDGALWYVQITFCSYAIFFLSNFFFHIKERKTAFMVMYFVLVGLLFVVLNVVQAPPFYYMNLWALIIGTGMACFETDNFLKKHFRFKIVLLSNVLISVSFAFAQPTMQIPYRNYFVSANLALLAILGLNVFFTYFQIKKDSLILLLSSMSYVVYLLHTKVLTLEWYFFDYISVVLPIIVILLCSYPISKINFFKGKNENT